MAKTKQSYLYRRSSGIYVVRICVPKRLQPAVGRAEIHISTGLRDARSAKIVALGSLLQWNQRVLELDNMDILKVVEGSPLFNGEGLIAVADVAQSLGLDTKTLLIEATNSKANLFCIAEGWRGTEISDIRELDRDFDGSFIVNNLAAKGHPVLAVGNLIFFDTAMAAKSFVESDEHIAEILYRDSKRRRAVFFDPGVTVGIANLLLAKNDAEIIRKRLLTGITPSMIETAKSLRPSSPIAASTPAAPASPTALPVHKYGNMRVSELLSLFLNAKHADWKPEQSKRMSNNCGVFVELMNDPILSDIDRPKITDYRNRLLTLPENLSLARRRHRINSLSDLIKAADRHGETRMSVDTANLYIRKLSEMFNWAVVEERMPRNPAIGVGKRINRNQREQDERDIFDEADLAKIFGAEWFVHGEGSTSRRGDYRYFQPHYYWLPLLGLFSGGRLNELAQLYLDDVTQTDDGCWYLDFNLNSADKIDADQKKETAAKADKSLKTVNSQRVVALHDQIITLGLPGYVEALRKAGHTRLFPELRYDQTKGYGKAAGSWFNERFLGRQLKIPRDGTKTFHSFRHTFISGLFDAVVPEVTVAQIAGHERGETMSGKRYRKDQAANQIKPYIDGLKFILPPIAPFNISAGISAVESALDRKRRHSSGKA